MAFDLRKFIDDTVKYGFGNNKPVKKPQPATTTQAVVGAKNIDTRPYPMRVPGITPKKVQVPNKPTVSFDVNKGIQGVKDFWSAVGHGAETGIGDMANLGQEILKPAGDAIGRGMQNLLGLKRTEAPKKQDYTKVITKAVPLDYNNASKRLDSKGLPGQILNAGGNMAGNLAAQAPVMMLGGGLGELAGKGVTTALVKFGVKNTASKLLPGIVSSGTNFGTFNAVNAASKGNYKDIPAEFGKGFLMGAPGGIAAPLANPVAKVLGGASTGLATAGVQQALDPKHTFDPANYALMAGMNAYGAGKAKNPEIAKDIISNQKSKIIGKYPDVTKPKFNLNQNEVGTLNDYADYKMKTYNPGRETNQLVTDAYDAAKKADIFKPMVSAAPIDAKNTIVRYIDELASRNANKGQTKVRQLPPERVKAILKKEKQTGSVANPLYKGDKTKVSVKEVPAITPEVGKTNKKILPTPQELTDKINTTGKQEYKGKTVKSVKMTKDKNGIDVTFTDGTIVKNAQLPLDLMPDYEIRKGVTVKNIEDINKQWSDTMFKTFDTTGQKYSGNEGGSLMWQGQFVGNDAMKLMDAGKKPTVKNILDLQLSEKRITQDAYNDMISNIKSTPQPKPEVPAITPEVKSIELPIVGKPLQSDIQNQAHSTPQVTKTPKVELGKETPKVSEVELQRLASGIDALGKYDKSTQSNLMDAYKKTFESKGINFDEALKQSKKYSQFDELGNSRPVAEVPEVVKPKRTMQEGRTAKALSGKTRYNGKVMDKREFISTLTQDGYKPQTRTINGKTKYVMESQTKKGDYYDITKTEYDLASKSTPQVTKTAKELPIVGKNLNASQKIVEPKIAPNTKIKLAVEPPKSQIKLKKEVQSSNPIIAEKALAETKTGLQKKYDDFERSIYGDTSSEIKGGTKGAGILQAEVRKGKQKFNQVIEKGLSSENNTIRRISAGTRALFGGAGDTAIRTSKKGQMRGGIDESINLSNDFKKLGDEMLPDKTSRERVWAVLDPELAGTKVKEADLSPTELKAVQTLRQASDLINDTNFSMNKISHETWLKGKDGKYITRAYEDYDLPPELADSRMLQPGKGKLDTGAYKARKEVDDWKMENAIKDPFYLASKRIQSTYRNKSITDYANWVNKQPDMISDVPRKGYTQLSDSNMWGELAGKNIRHDVLTDIKGFYSDSKALQGAYEALGAYDRFLPRQVLKKTKTVLNPATRLGNQTANRVFAAFNGINIAKFEWNMHKFAPQELAKNGKYARLLRKEGILGTDMTKYELVRKLTEDGVEPSKIKKASDKIVSSYGAADDKAKLSALKYWLDRGKTTEEALIKVRNGFQDYSKVGLLYDIGAKTPFVGKPFIRFQSELARIIKNSITENPLSIATVVGSIALIGNLASQASGETPEDKATREGRFGTPVVPFTQIPLVFQTPIGEINVARMFGMYETAGADTKNKNLIQRASKYLPFDIPTSKDDAVKTFGNDVLLGGISNQITDTDFRGKSISDPDSNKYQPSTLTDAEKLANRTGAAYHNYQLPIVNDIENVGRSVMGLKDQYGSIKTVPQALSKLSGFKITQFGAKEAEEQRAKDVIYADYDKQDIKKQINSVIKQRAEGKIDANTAKARIDNLNKNSGSNTNTKNNKVFANPSGGFSYLDSNGSLQTAKTEQLANQEIAKMDFEKSGKAFQEKDGIIYRVDEYGKVTATPKQKYEYQLGKSKLTQYKDRENLDGWMQTAQSQLESIDKQLQDKSIDPKDKIDLENDAYDLIKSMQKYAGYGGFTKPKSGSSKKSTLDYAKLFSDTYKASTDNQQALRQILSKIKITRKKVAK